MQQSTVSPFKGIARTLSWLAVAAVLGGCSVKPQPLPMDAIQARAQESRQAMFQNQEPLLGPLTLGEAMARAVKYNLSHRVQLMEEAVTRKQLVVSHFDLLPQVAAGAGVVSRTAANKKTGHPAESDEGEADLSFTWNILDFGVSYYRAQQQADQVLIMQERERKVVHNLMQEVRTAYWRALGAERMEGRLVSLKREVEKELALLSVKTLSLEELERQKELLETLRQMEGIRHGLSTAKPTLAALINLPPGSTFTLKAPESLSLPTLGLTLAELEEAALVQRPELIENDYQERINLNETHKAMSSLLPGIDVSGGGFYDSNPYLVNQHWAEGGLRITMNLVNLLTGAPSVKLAEADVDVARQKRLALNMAVLSQIHVAHGDFAATKERFERDEKILQVSREIQSRFAALGDKGDPMAKLRSDSGVLMSEWRYYGTYADLQNAFGRIQSSIGHDPLPRQVASHDLSTLTLAFNANFPAVTYGDVFPVMVAEKDGDIPGDEEVATPPLSLAEVTAAPVETASSVENIRPSAPRLMVAPVESAVIMLAATAGTPASPPQAPAVEASAAQASTASTVEASTVEASTADDAPKVEQVASKASGPDEEMILNLLTDATEETAPQDTASGDAETAVQAVVQGWADAWSARDGQRFFSYYGEAFRPPFKKSREQWEKDRDYSMRRAGFINVKLSNLNITPGHQAGTITASFLQDFVSDRYQGVSFKQLTLQESGGTWRIIRERSGDVKVPPKASPETLQAQRTPSHTPLPKTGAALPVSHEQEAAAGVLAEAAPQEAVENEAEVIPQAPALKQEEAAAQALDQEKATAWLQEWAKAWSARDGQRFFAFYADSFRPPFGKSRKQWEQDRDFSMRRAGFIKVDFSDVQVIPGDNPQQATLVFVQDFASDRYQGVSEKRLHLSRENGQWRIVRERAKDLPVSVKKETPRPQGVRPANGEPAPGGRAPQEA